MNKKLTDCAILEKEFNPVELDFDIFDAAAKRLSPSNIRELVEDPECRKLFGRPYPVCGSCSGFTLKDGSFISLCVTGERCLNYIEMLCTSIELDDMLKKKGLSYNSDNMKKTMDLLGFMGFGEVEGRDVVIDIDPEIEITLQDYLYGDGFFEIKQEITIPFFRNTEYCFNRLGRLQEELFKVRDVVVEIFTDAYSAVTKM